MEAHRDQAARGREAPIASYAETQAAVRPPRARAGDLPASWPILLILALQAAVSVARLRNTAFQDEALYLGPMLVLAVLVKYAGILFVLPMFAVLACVPELIRKRPFLSLAPRAGAGHGSFTSMTQVKTRGRVMNRQDLRRPRRDHPQVHAPRSGEGGGSGGNLR